MYNTITITFKVSPKYDFNNVVKEVLSSIADPRFTEEKEGYLWFIDYDIVFADEKKRMAVVSVTAVPKHIGYILVQILNVEGIEITEVRKYETDVQM